MPRAFARPKHCRLETLLALHSVDGQTLAEAATMERTMPERA